MRRATPALAVLLAAGLAAPTAALAAVSPTWSSSSDGQLTADVVEFLHAASNTDQRDDKPVVNAPNRVYAAGTAQRDGSTGRTDDDVLFSAYDTMTGDVTSVLYDCGTVRATSTNLAEQQDLERGPCVAPGTDEDLVSFTVSGMNNLGFATMNVDGWGVVVQKLALSSMQPATGSGSRLLVPGASAADADTTWTGSAIVIAGSRGGKFWSASKGGLYDPLQHDATTVNGAAVDVDIRNRDGAETALVTGHQSAPGGSDIRVELWSARAADTAEQFWSRTWAGPAGRIDTAARGHEARVDGRLVEFVVGTTVTEDYSKDIVVLAYDGASGDLLWDEIWGNWPGLDDVPTDLRYDEASGHLFVAGTSQQRDETGSRDGTDVVLLALDALTGEVQRTAFASGDISHGVDDVIALEVTPADVNGDKRVVVLAQAHNFLHTGGFTNTLFAFDTDLHPAGSVVVNSMGTGLPLGAIAFNHGYQDVRDVVVGVRGPASAPLDESDQFVQRLPRADFVVQTIDTAIDFTGNTTAEVVAGDSAVVEAVLAEADGTPVAGAEVTLGFGLTAQQVRTDATGVARGTFDTTDLDGTYPITAAFTGSGPLAPSQAASTIQVARLATKLAFTDQTSSRVTAGDPAVVEVALSDAEGQPVAGRPVSVTLGGSAGTATTDDGGIARLQFATDALDAGTHDVSATWAGDGRYEPSSAATTIAVEVPVPDWTASATSTAKGVTLAVDATSAGDETATVSFDVDWFADERDGKGGDREATGVRALVLTVEAFVDGAWDVIHTESRPEAHAFDGSQDWTTSFEALEAAGTYRVTVDGVLLRADGSDLAGRGVRVGVELS